MQKSSLSTLNGSTASKQSNNDGMNTYMATEANETIRPRKTYVETIRNLKTEGDEKTREPSPKHAEDFE